MADDWKLKAIREQFRVFHTLSEPYQSIPLNWLTRAIKEVIDQHFVLRPEDRNKLLPRGPESITQTITKVKGFKQNEQIKFNFIVIVNNHLSKIPIFVLQLEGRRIFIDIGCTVYNSWDAFMKNHNLPPIKFCLPVNGMYDVGNKLKIDFASSRTFYWHKFMLWGGVLVSAAVVVGSFFFSLPATVVTGVRALVPIAESFIPNLSGVVNLTFEILNLINHIKQGGFNIDIFESLNRIYRIISKEYSGAMSELWEDLRSSVSRAYNFLKRKLSSFSRARKSAQHRMLAVTHAIDNQVVEITREASKQLSQAKSSGVYNYQPKPNQMNMLSQSMTVDDAYYKQIFANCQTDYTLNYGVNKKNEWADGDISETTCSLITTTEHFAKKYSCTSLDDVSTLLIAITQLVCEEYKRKINSYENNVNAAKISAVRGSDINMDTYNKSLGIYGSPEKHFWKEAMEHILNSTYGAVTVPIEMRRETIEAQQGIILVQVLKKPGNINLGLFICNGVRGGGKFSAQDLLSVIKERIDFNEDEVVVTGRDDMLIIRCETLLIVTHQVVDDGNNSEGFVFIDETK